MKYFYIIFITLLFSSCSNPSNRDILQRIVEEWQGKQIVLPDDMTDLLTGDAIDLSDADFTILTYVDSTGCTGCKMKLPLWKEFLNSIDSISDADVQFLMVVYPSDIQELRYHLIHNEFDYSVYLDDASKVSKAYTFPEKTILQSFLLDKNYRVIVVGNPVFSSEIAKLYKGIILGQMSVETKTRNIVSVDNSRVSLGNLHQGETRSHEIVFSNQGNDTVRIAKVISSCECTELSLQKRYIPPKSDMKTVLQFTGDTVTGYFERSVHIYYSDFEYPTVITVSGNILN